MDKITALKDLLLIKKVLDQHKIPFFIEYGTLLGAYREKDFIDDDDDIDIGIIEKIDYKTRKIAGWMLYDLGFHPDDIVFRVFDRWEVIEAGYNGTEKTGIIVSQKGEGPRIDIKFYYDDGKDMVCEPRMGSQKLIGTPNKFFDKLETIKFKGVKFSAPGPIEKYLEWCYRDWKNPLDKEHGKLYFERYPEKQDMLEGVGVSLGSVIKNSSRKRL